MKKIRRVSLENSREDAIENVLAASQFTETGKRQRSEDPSQIDSHLHVSSTVKNSSYLRNLNPDAVHHKDDIVDKFSVISSRTHPDFEKKYVTSVELNFRRKKNRNKSGYFL